MTKKIEEHMFILFGSTGDLTKRMLIPSLYNLEAKGLLPRQMPIVCVGRHKHTNAQYIKSLEIAKFIPHAKKSKLDAFFKRIRYVQLDFDNTDHKKFDQALTKINAECNCQGNKIFYLATPPFLFKPILSILKKSNALDTYGWRRVVFEKPFGDDLKSALNLHKSISKTFSEKEIYRTDHYLGKELLQNIMTFRFSNAIFEQIWNRKFIDHVQITVSEKIGMGRRGPFYDKTGAVRDFLQNHLLQIVALTAMERPGTLEADDIRDQKVKIFKKIRKVNLNDVILGQYTAGTINGKKVDAYRKELNVDPNSNTETYVAAKIFIDNAKWKDVPFYVRTGKRLSHRYAEVNVVLKDVSSQLFGLRRRHTPHPNVITFRIQPDEGIAIRFNTKSPGAPSNLEYANMDYSYQSQFMETPIAHEVLFHSLMLGDQTLFTRWDGVERSWRYVQPIVNMLKRGDFKLHNYKAGSTGPKEADKLLERDGKVWINSHEVHDE